VEIEQAVESVWALFRETDRQFEETDRRPDQRFEETRQEIAALSESIRAAEDLFLDQWDRLIAALVKPEVASLFQAWGITIDQTLQRLEARRGGGEIDLLLATARRKVQDGQTSVGQGNPRILVDPVPGIIGTAVDQDIGYTPYDLNCRIRRDSRPGKNPVMLHIGYS